MRRKKSIISASSAEPPAIESTLNEIVVSKACSASANLHARSFRQLFLARPLTVATPARRFRHSRRTPAIYSQGRARSRSALARGRSATANHCIIAIFFDKLAIDPLRIPRAALRELRCAAESVDLLAQPDHDVVWLLQTIHPNPNAGTQRRNLFLQHLLQLHGRDSDHA